VVCCDGTGNQVGRNLSNVLKLYRCLRQDDAQVTYYDPGVGTLGRRNMWQRARDTLRTVWGLATGAGLDDNVLEAYRFIVRAYRAGDRIYLFGFSRGAHTARVVAAMIHVVGLLRPEQLNLADYALDAYKRSRLDDDTPSAALADAMREYGIEPAEAPAEPQGESLGRYFGRIVRARRVPIRFLGVWDTVSSVIVPRAFSLIPRLEILSFTRRNPSVEIFRQAASIDEKRRLFRLDPWIPGAFDPQGTDPDPPAQNCRQVWFAGYHSDVGGGRPESQSAIAKFPLKWMIEEAKAPRELSVDDTLVAHFVDGVPSPGQDPRLNRYVAADATGPIHNSLKWLWLLLEILPKRTRRHPVWPRRWRLFGWYIPWGEPRIIPGSDPIHPSVAKRMEALPGYRPVNLDSRSGP